MGQQGAVVDGVQRSVPLTSPSPRPRWLPGKGASPAPPSAATSSDDACRRSGMKSTLRWVDSRTLEALQRVTSKSPHAVVYGAPPDEGNAVEVVRGLSRRYRGDIYWFVDGDLRARMGEIPPNVYVIVKHSPAAMARYLSAEIASSLTACTATRCHRRGRRSSTSGTATGSKSRSTGQQRIDRCTLPISSWVAPQSSHTQEGQHLPRA